ncbi:MAG: competence protein ComEA [Moraxellaceae bacterium]|jgi:competence protein ComEA|nr:competence protein ComEA [Moraxellaceae bacterium]
MMIRFLALLLVLYLPQVQALDAPRPVAKASRPVAASVGGRVNVNTANLTALTALKGVGEKKAQAIIAYRREHGPFNSLEQFEEVPGIGPALIENNRGRIIFR